MALLVPFFSNRSYNRGTSSCNCWVYSGCLIRRGIESTRCGQKRLKTEQTKEYEYKVGKQGKPASRTAKILVNCSNDQDTRRDADFPTVCG